MTATKRGRRAQTHFTGRSQFSPPKDLQEELIPLWKSIIAQAPPEQFRPSDEPLLRSYVEAASLAREAHAKLLEEGQLTPEGRPSPWLAVSVAHAKTLASLAGKLRLCPSSRIRAESSSLKQLPAGPRPWDRDPAAQFFATGSE